MKSETSTGNNSSKFVLIGIVIIAAIVLLLSYCHKKAHAPKVYFGNLKDSAQVESPFKVDMMAENLVVEPAANGVAEGHGHFHIIIDSPLPSVGEPVPMDSLHLHYGKGQTSTTLDLTEGEHALTLQFANGNHIPYDPQVVQTIHVHVTKRNPSPVTQDSMDMETVATSKTVTTQNNAHRMHPGGGKELIKPDSFVNTPPPIDPGHGGGMGVGAGGGTGGGMGGH